MNPSSTPDQQPPGTLPGGGRRALSLRRLVSIAAFGCLLYLALLGSLLEVAISPRRAEIHRGLRQLLEAHVATHDGPAQVPGVAAAPPVGTEIARQSRADRGLRVVAAVLGVPELQQARQNLSASLARPASDAFRWSESGLFTAGQVQALQQELHALDIIQTRAIALWIGVGLLLLPFLYWLVQRRFMQPLNALADAMRLVGSGQVGLTLPVRWRDELGTLTARFNETSELLRQHHLGERWRHTMMSASRVRALLEGTTDAGILVDARGRISEWNAAAVTLLHLPRHGVLGRRISDVVLPGAGSAATRALVDSLARGERPATTRGTLELMRRGGGRICAEWLVVPLRHGDGTQEFGLFLRESGSAAPDAPWPPETEQSPGATARAPT